MFMDDDKVNMGEEEGEEGMGTMPDSDGEGVEEKPMDDDGM